MKSFVKLLIIMFVISILGGMFFPPKDKTKVNVKVNVQKKEVEVVKLIARNTIEEKIISLQEDKKELIESIMSCDDISNAVINKKVVEELVNTYIEN